MMTSLICAAVILGTACAIKAATPATCGVAIDVPPSPTYAVVLFVGLFWPPDTEVTSSPGAHASGLMRPSAVGPSESQFEYVGADGGVAESLEQMVNAVRESPGIPTFPGVWFGAAPSLSPLPAAITDRTL